MHINVFSTAVRQRSRSALPF